MTFWECKAWKSLSPFSSCSFMCVWQLDTEAADILNELQVKLSTVLDNFSAMFAKRYCNTHTHTHTIFTRCLRKEPPPHSDKSSSASSFQTRINGCMRQMAEILYQIKGPPNHNTAEADADTMLRPLMEFLDGK